MFTIGSDFTTRLDLLMKGQSESGDFIQLEPYHFKTITENEEKNGNLVLYSSHVIK